MAVSILSADGVKAVTCDASAGDTIAVTFPTGTKFASFFPRSAAGKVSHTGSESGAIGADYITLPADKWTTIELKRSVHGSPPVVWVAHVNAAGVMEIAPGRVSTEP